MKDRKLERDIKDIKEFIDLWVSFKDQFHSASQKEHISPEEEKKFLETKSLIARKYETVARIFDTPDDKAMDIVAQVVSLDSAAKMSEMQLKKLENDWHFSYINFNKLLGSLENTREELAKISGFKLALRKALFNPFMLLVWIIILIIIVFMVLQKTELIDNIKEKLNLPTKESGNSLSFES